MTIRKESDLKENIKSLVDDYLNEKIKVFKYFAYGLLGFFIIFAGLKFSGYDLFALVVKWGIEDLAKEKKLNEPIKEAVENIMSAKIIYSFGSSFRLGKNFPINHYIPFYMNENQKAKCLMVITHEGKTGEKNKIQMLVGKFIIDIDSDSKTPSTELKYKMIVDEGYPNIVEGHDINLHIINFMIRNSDRVTDDVINVTVLINIYHE